DVLLDRGLGDHLGGLVEAGVDHLEAGVTERARYHLRAAVVPVEPGLRDEDAEGPPLVAHNHAGSRYWPNASRYTSEISPTVQSAFMAATSGGMRFSSLSAAARTRFSAARAAAPSRSRFTRRTRSACR